MVACMLITDLLKQIGLGGSLVEFVSLGAVIA